MSNTNNYWANEILNDLTSKGLKRSLVHSRQSGPRFELDGREYINFSSNDYLNLAHNSELIDAAKMVLESQGTSSSSSRLLSGTLSEHVELERELCSFFNVEASLVFSSGYLTNLGLISTLVGRNDVVISDKLSHASIVDGIRLSGAEKKRFRHNDGLHLREILEELQLGEKKRVLIVTESLFSMNGDVAPLEDVVSLAKEYQAMIMVDEAHAIGVFGKGICAKLGLLSEVDVLVGTFGKALGSYGGFCLCSNVLRDVFINKSRSFIYNTSLPPSVVAASKAAIHYLEKNSDLGLVLLNRASLFRDSLVRGGFNVCNSESHILPIIVGDAKMALEFASRLKENGIIAMAIRPPTVPQGTSRIRFSLSLGHSEQQLENAVSIIQKIGKELGICSRT